MAKEWAKAFYHSEAWHKVRLGYIAHRRSIDGGMCEMCHERSGEIIHHKIHLSPANINDPKVALSQSNLMYVCHDCHDKIHEHCGRDGNALPIRKIFFDESGEPTMARFADWLDFPPPR